MSSKHSYKFIREQFIKEGYKLISNEYHRSSEKLIYICQDGHTNSMTYDNFRGNKRCPDCKIKRIKQTKLDRYGDENYRNKDKAKQTCLEKYGVENPFQNKGIQDKAKRTCLEKYGVENVLQLEKNIKKSKEKRKEWFSKKENRIDFNKKVSFGISKLGFIERYGEELGLKKYKKYRDKRNKTLSLDGFVERFGVELGTIKFLEYKSKLIGFGYSKISQKLFWQIYNKLPKELQEKTYFAEHNREFKKSNIERKLNYSYDFVISNIKFCLEYNGDDFHANPKLYKENDTPNFYSNTLKSKEIWEYDKTKLNFLEQLGFNTLVVWDSEYKENGEKISNQVIDKIKEIYAF